MKNKTEICFKLVAVFYYCMLATTVICTGIVAFYPKLQYLFFIPVGFFLLELVSGTIYGFRIDKEINETEHSMTMKEYYEREFDKLCELHDKMLEDGEIEW